jgi:hypothetical protein
MISPSNLYAEKIFAEHPLSLWALDDKSDYVSLISEEQRKVSDWSVTGGTASVVTDITDEPFINSYTTKILGDVPSTGFGTIECIGDDLFNFTSLNLDLGTFCIGSYFYNDSTYVSAIEIGYEYYDSTTGTNIQHLKHVDTGIYGKWIFISETFHIPSDNTTMRPVIKIKYLSGAENSSSYTFYINGITVGQWSEEFNSTSLGVAIQSIPSDINIAVDNGLEAKAYGLQSSSGYYLFDETSLCAKSSGIPLVFGSSNSTILLPNENVHPSLIIPGQGFLNELGKFKEYTVEMWIRINSDSTTMKRIFGPVASEDGLYVNGPFITLKVGNSFESYCVGEWCRPMLTHIRITKDTASLLINGDQVISFSFSKDELDLPTQFTNGKSNDWLAFYAYDDVSPIEVDCVAIYPYQVPAVVAKRRFVYGQGVQIPENINTAYSGTSVFIDYPFANYANNYSYPDTGNWSQGSINNLSIENNVLSLPDYQVPQFVTSSTTFNVDNLYADNKALQSEEELFLTLKPSSSWDTLQSYFLFNNYSPLNTETSAIYGMFLCSESSSKQTLMRIEDDASGNYISIDIENSVVKYSVNGITNPLYTQEVDLNEKFVAGFKINDFSNYFGGTAASILGNRGSLKIYVGGNKNLSNTFAGKIYSVNFDNNFNIGNNSATYNSKGIIENVGSHVSSYSLKPATVFDEYMLDIDLVGSWEDQLPLTYFAKYTEDAQGNINYNINFLQFNINYPAPSTYVETETESTWNYSELKAAYQVPVQRSYEALDNHLFTGYNNYQDLANRSEKSYNFDTGNSLVRAYATFQYTASGANTPANSFAYTVGASSDGIVRPGTYIVDVIDGENIYDSFVNSRYEIVDNTILYPPKGIDFNKLSVVIHLEFNVRQISKNPLKVKSLQIASQAFGSGPNKIGTRFGTSIYPYKKVGVYYDYETDNPFVIYKGSTPYLYLTRKSGIQIKGKFDPMINRGLGIPINEGFTDDYKVMAMQVAVRYDYDFFPYSPVEIFEIESKGSFIKFFMVADSPTGKRAKIYAIDGNTGAVIDGIAFYLNGNIVSDPVITTKQWSILGISFPKLLNFDNYVGALRINGPLTANLISHYKSTNLQTVQIVTKRPWFKVESSGGLDLDWDFWDTAYKWQGVLVLSSTSYYGVNPADIYKAYSGTNKIIVDDYNSQETNPKILSFNNYEYNVYSEITWQSSVQNAV